MSDKLVIYLNDHLAGSVGGIELAKRAADNNADNSLGQFLNALSRELEEDQAALKEALRRIGGTENSLKQGAACLAEKVGRWNLNDEILKYSDLSRVLELEGLSAGIQGKRQLWIALQQLAAVPTHVGMNRCVCNLAICAFCYPPRMWG